MTVTSPVILRKPTSLSAAAREQLRLLLYRHRWELPIMTLALFAADWWILFALKNIQYATLDVGSGFIWTSLYPISLFKAVIAAFWGLWIWKDESPDRRTSLWTMPISRSSNHLVRISLGALLLMISYLVAWYAGLGISALLCPVRGLIAGFLPPLSWLVLFLSYLNIYLLASIIALRAEHPQQWLFLYLPLGFLIIFGVRLLFNIQPIRMICGPILPPYGLLGGLGVELWDAFGTRTKPVMWAPLIWFMLILGAVIYSASRHQER